MIETSIIVVIVLITVISVYILLDKKLKQLAEAQKSDASEISLKLLNQSMQGVQERLDKVGDGLNTRLDNAARVINSVNKELGQVQEMSRSMQSLQNFLKSPKLRGNIGEQVLYDLLNQQFPKELFATQYKFNSGQMVDAIIRTDNGMICIDAKFPLDNFEKLARAETEASEQEFRKLFVRDVKKHIKDISKKYILPDEGTTGFALMYVPSEAIYYEIIREDTELNTVANQYKVLLVSPNGIYYFLQVLLTALQGKRIEEQAQQILTTMDGIVKDAEKFSETLGVLTTHISNASGALDRVNTEYNKLNAKIDQIKLLQ